MKKYIESIVKPIVDKPQEVRVTEIKGDPITVYEIYVGEGDYENVFGKRGEIADSIRILLRAASEKKGTRVALEILDL